MVDITQDHTVQHFHLTFSILEDNLVYRQQSKYATSSVGNVLLYEFDITTKDNLASTAILKHGHPRKFDA